MEQIFQILNNLNIPYDFQEHKAIFSEKDSKNVVITLEGTEVKNLFVKDKNNNYGLVSPNALQDLLPFCFATCPADKTNTRLKEEFCDSKTLPCA